MTALRRRVGSTSAVVAATTSVRRACAFARLAAVLVMVGCAGPADAPALAGGDEPRRDAPSRERPAVDLALPATVRLDDRERLPEGAPTGLSHLADVSCPSGQSDCGGACQSTGAACTVGVGACAATGTVVCGAGAPDLAAHGTVACALGAGGTVQCWGSNTYGALGNGTTVTSASPVRVRGLRNATAVAVGLNHACALLADATVRCWGRNHQGQLGDGTTTQRLAPVAVSGITDATAIVAHGDFTCALRSDGTAACWGYNASGQLGDGTTTRRLTPGPVPSLTGITRLAAGASHACAVLGDGTVWCWGLNTNGQLGDGTLVTRSTPAPVAGVAGATSVVAGAAFTCAVLGDGTAQCWGQNSNGQLGDGTTTRRPLPVVVGGLTGATQLAAGASHACATLGDGTARCWGANAYGQLGDGTITQHATATTVPGLAGAVKLVAGDRSACALLVGGAVQCWGDNASGQLGDGTNATRTTPVAVVGLDAGTTCSAVESAPTTEVCDGVDNDCNGVVDDVAPTACIPGACATRGHRACGAGPGFATLCVADVLRAAGTVCRAAVAGGCDVAESCDGVRAECPTDVVQAAGTQCRGATGVCDVAEVCTGVSNACPVDAVSPAGTECRAAAAGGCDVAEACTGAAKTCPTDRFLPSTTVCRGAAGPCDVAETCRGNAAACPVDALRPSNFTCRPAVAGGCDVAELCTGGAATCPSDTVRLAGTVCRPAVSALCDVAEVCDGTSGACPANVVRPAGTSCRAANGVCDVREVCDGTSGSCPVDAFLPSSVVCRGAFGTCDAIEYCTGASRTCPVNVRQPAGTTCRTAGNDCVRPEVCTGASDNCPPVRTALSGTPCRPAVGPCDVAEVCSGGTPICPFDSHVPNDTSCDDGDSCTQTAACTAGVCVRTAAIDCDDGNPCTADACSATCIHTPLAACRAGILSPPNPPVDTAVATQESSGVELIDPAGAVAPGAFSVTGLGVRRGEVARLITGWNLAPTGTLSTTVSVRFPIGGAPGALYAVAGRVDGVWQFESVARVTADGAHAVAQLSRFGEHAVVSMVGCDSPTGSSSGSGPVGDPQRWAPQSPVVASENGGTWAWLTQGVYIHVGSQDMFVEEGPRSADEDSVRMSGNGQWLVYVRDGIRRYDVSTLHPGDDFLDFTTVSLPDLPSGDAWQYEALSLSWAGDRMVFLAEDPTASRADIFLWEQGAGIRPLTSSDGHGGSVAINGTVREIALSANGRWMSFVTDATDVVPSFASPGGVYLRDLETGDTTLVAPAGSVRSTGASISRSGRFVAWRAPFVDDDTVEHLWVWDRATNVRTEVNRDADGTRWTVEQWGMSNDGTRFVFGGFDDDPVHPMKARTRWLRAGASTPLYAAGVSPEFGEVSGVFPVITGSGGYVFAGEYFGVASPPARAVSRYRVPVVAIPGAAAAVAADRWEYEPFRVGWGGFSPVNSYGAFVWEPALGSSTPVPMEGDAGDVEVSPLLPLGRHAVVTVQSFEAGDGIGACATWNDFQVSRARESILPTTLSNWQSAVSTGARYLTPIIRQHQTPDGATCLDRYDRRRGVLECERVEGLTLAANAFVETSAINPSGRRVYARVYEHTFTTETYTDYFIDLTHGSMLRSHQESNAYIPSLHAYVRKARLSFDGSVVYPYYDYTYDSDGARLTGHSIYALEGADATEQFLRPSRYLGGSGRELAAGGAVPFGDGTRALFLEYAESPDYPTVNHHELREWDHVTGNDPMILSWPDRLNVYSDTDCLGRSRQPVQVATTSGQRITFCADTPLGFPDAPVAPCRAADGARWLYDQTTHELQQLSTRCVDSVNSPPAFVLNETVLVYIDLREDGLLNLVVYDFHTHVARVVVDGIASIRDLSVSLGGTHATFGTGDRAYVERRGLTWPGAPGPSPSLVWILAPLQDEYLGEVVPEAP